MNRIRFCGAVFDRGGWVAGDLDNGGCVVGALETGGFVVGAFVVADLFCACTWIPMANTITLIRSLFMLLS